MRQGTLKGGQDQWLKDGVMGGETERKSVVVKVSKDMQSMLKEKGGEKKQEGKEKEDRDEKKRGSICQRFDW